MTKRFIGLLSFLMILTYSCDQIHIEVSHPLEAIAHEKGVWNWMDVDGMICRDSSPTGIGVRFGEDSKKWVIYLQGGGACFTEETCQTNPSSFNEEDFMGRVENGAYVSGLMNIDREENPVQDWNFIFVPYCTGDVHSGNNPGSFGLGLSEEQQYVGARNIATLLEFIAPYLKQEEVDEIMLAGISAGGFGTHLSYYELKKHFPDTKTHVINDSGPLMSDPEIFPVCLMLGFQLIYDLPIPPGFLVCCRPTYGLADIYTYNANLFPNDNFGLISHLEDETIRYFFFAGQNTCQGGEVSGELYTQGLYHLRENVLKPTGNISTFFRNGENHTFIQGNTTFYDSPVNGKYLYATMYIEN